MNNSPTVPSFPPVPTRSGNAPTDHPFPRSRPIGAERWTGTVELFDNSNNRSQATGTTSGMFEDLRELDDETRASIPDKLLDRMADLDVPGALTEQSLRACLHRTGIARAKVKPHCVRAKPPGRPSLDAATAGGR